MADSPAGNSTSASPPGNKPVSRRRMLRGIGAVLAAPAIGALYGTQIEPFWPEFHETALPIANLPAAFSGLRVAHLTDLHIASGASRDLVKKVVRRVNELSPDLVAVTGDLITHSMGWLDDVCALLGALKSPAFVSLGNHDYGVQNWKGRLVETSDVLTSGLSKAGCTVLRNQHHVIEKNGARLWLTGLEDLWSRRFSPTSPPAGGGEPVLALSHNPDTALTLDNYGISCILSGHTHGGQIRCPGLGALMLPVQNRQFQAGLYPLPKSRLYISRGIGYLMRVRLNCRPEVPIHVLQNAIL